jgi:hypothetical protein
MVLPKLQHCGQFNHHAVLIVTAMVSDNMLWDAEPNNDLVKDEIQ